MATDIPSIIFPRYINEERLNDIYSQLNDGLVISKTTSDSDQSTVHNQTGGRIEGGILVAKGGIENTHTEKQYFSKDTSTTKQLGKGSILKSVLMNENICNKEIHESNENDIIVTKVKFELNSLEPLVNSMEQFDPEMTKNHNQRKNKNRNSNNRPNANPTSNIEMLKAVASEDNLLQDTDTYAVSARFDKSSLYNSSVQEITGVNLNCLCVVKRIMENGGKLFDGDFWSILPNGFFESLESVVEAANNSELNVHFVPIVKDKKVFMIEIIALF